MKNQKEKPTEDDAIYKGAMKQLFLVSFVSIFFIIAQSIGGYLANSVAIYTDTAHLASDMLGFVMSMISLRISKRGIQGRLTYGW